jgi:hypothetical protein
MQFLVSLEVVQGTVKFELAKFKREAPLGKLRQIGRGKKMVAVNGGFMGSQRVKGKDHRPRTRPA